MTTPNELTLVEKPILQFMEGMGYRVIGPDQHPSLRARENEVLFKPLVAKALRDLNDLDESTALAIYNELAGLSDNERWVDILRGKTSRKVPGEETHRTIRLVDFERPENNDWAVTSQLRVQGEVVRKPDVVVTLNGIPVVVIEARSPINPSQNSFDAIDQIRMYEADSGTVTKRGRAPASGSSGSTCGRSSGSRSGSRSGSSSAGLHQPSTLEGTA